MFLQILFTLCLILQKFTFISTQYNPSWESLDKRPIPAWYDEAKIGIFLHWGVYSVPSFNTEWFWKVWKGGSKDYQSFIEKNYPPNFTYQDFAKDFTAEFFNPNEWASLFKASGAKYVVVTSKHHEGFTLWPSKYSYSWNAKDIGPHRDLIGELSTSIREEKLVFGAYYSLYEWFNPIYLSDKRNNFGTQEFVINKIIPEMRELINLYEPTILWTDGDWDAEDTYWKSTEFLAWLYNDSPVAKTVVVNDRWGSGTPCTHGDFFTCQDRFNPGVLIKHKWENAMSLDKVSWGFRRNALLSDYLTTHELITILAETISCGGNLLINVGPTKDGIITPIFRERLLDIGAWLKINGDAIYGSTPWTYQKDSFQTGVWYTQKDSAVYAIVLNWPPGNTLVLGSVIDILQNNDTVITMLEEPRKLKWTRDEITETVLIKFLDKSLVKSEHAWVIKIGGS